MPLLPALLIAAATSAIHATAFVDVPMDAWYAKPVLELAQDRHIDPNKTHFRPESPATRAEFLKLAMSISGHPLSTPPMLESFTDVHKADWFFPIMEEAAKEGWMRGDHNCYGSPHCRAYPHSPITRAQAAALLVRIFVLERISTVRHAWIDVGDTDWFAYAVWAMADRCILQGNEETLRIRPHDGMNRAEMAVMFRRAQLVMSGQSLCLREIQDEE